MLWIIGIHLSPDDHHWRPSSALKSFPIQEVPLSRYWPFVGFANDFRHWITGISSPNNLFPAVVIYIELADIGRSSADAGTISSHFWKKMNDNERLNPGSSFIFLMILHTVFVVFYYYITFFILCYMNILEFHSILYAQLLIPAILLTSTVDVFVLLTGVEPGQFILRRQHSTPRLQGACACGFLVSPRRNLCLGLI